jgi:phosphate-selective porin OprO/OprP
MTSATLLAVAMFLAQAASTEAARAVAPDGTGKPAAKSETLEERVARLEQAQAQAAAPEKKGGLTGEGFVFSTDDGNFKGSINGRMLAHYRSVIDRPDEDAAPLRTVPNSFFIRQARIEANLTWYKEFTGKVQYDIPTGTYNQTTGAVSSTTGTLRDAFVAWHRWKEFSVRAGQFFEPLSQEDVTSTRFIDFVERSVMNRLLPGREIGLAVYGSLLEDKLAYEVMVCNGNALLNDQGRSVNDGNDEKELAARFYVFPLEGLRLGAAASFGEADDLPATGFDLVTTELAVMWLDGQTGPVFDGTRRRYVINASYATGPFSVRGELFFREDELQDPNPESALESMGYYVYGTWLLTGEKKTPEARVTPAQAFLEGGGIGAVELAIRFAHVEVDNAEDAGLIPAAGNAQKVDVVTVGVNWWPVKYVRVSVNFIHEMYDEDLAFENGREEDSMSGVLARFQIDF